jgi:hypothetical protein
LLLGAPSAKPTTTPFEIIPPTLAFPPNMCRQHVGLITSFRQRTYFYALWGVFFFCRRVAMPDINLSSAHSLSNTKRNYYVFITRNWLARSRSLFMQPFLQVLLPRQSPRNMAQTDIHPTTPRCQILLSVTGRHLTTTHSGTWSLERF